MRKFKFGDMAEVEGWPDPHKAGRGPIKVMWIGWAARPLWHHSQVGEAMVVSGFAYIGHDLYGPGDVGLVDPKDMTWIIDDD